VQKSENKHSEYTKHALEQLSTNLKEIGEKSIRLKKENQLLQEEVLRLEKLVKIQKNSIQKLEEKLKTKIIAEMLGSKDKTTAKHRLTKLIEDVEACMKLLEE
jgi:hypothetical protein